MLSLGNGDDMGYPVEISGVEVAAENGRTVRRDGRPKIVELLDLFFLIDPVVLMDADYLRTAPGHRNICHERNADPVFEVKLVPRERHGMMGADLVPAENGEPFIGIALECECLREHEPHAESFRGLFREMKARRIQDLLKQQDPGFTQIGFCGELRDQLRTGFFIKVERCDTNRLIGGAGGKTSRKSREDSRSKHPLTGYRGSM